MTTPTGLHPRPGERARRAPCGCLETDTRLIELCDGCLKEWNEMHESARAQVMRERMGLCRHGTKHDTCMVCALTKAGAS